MYSKSTMILIIAVALISLTCGSPIDTEDTRADTFTRNEKINDKYEVSWEVNKATKEVKFTVVAKSLGYVGFGISDSGTMNNADLVIGGVDTDKKSYFTDRFATGHTTVVDTQQDWVLVSATEDTEKTTLVFSRKFVTGDTTQDVDITDKDTKFIWALGSDDDITHHAERGDYAVNILKEPGNGEDESTTEKGGEDESTTEKGGASGLKISSLSCALSVFLIAMKYLY